MSRALRVAALAGFAACGLPAADHLAARYAGQGELIVASFASAPFPHSARAEGHRYKDEFYPAQKHYQDNRVALFIPKGFRQTGTIDCVVHFHGWRNHIEQVLERYHLIEQLIASGRNAVLVVPQGPYDAPDSFGGKLEDADGFKRFMEEVLSNLRSNPSLGLKGPQIGKIILSGHSGGYRVISAILDHGGMTDQIREVWLFDALYGQTEKFQTWSERKGVRLLNIYTDGGGTRTETETLMKTLRAQGRAFLAAEEANRPDLRSQRLIFLHTTLAHDEVMEKHKTFCGFLKNSGLEAMKNEE